MTSMPCLADIMFFNPHVLIDKSNTSFSWFAFSVHALVLGPALQGPLIFGVCLLAVLCIESGSHLLR